MLRVVLGVLKGAIVGAAVGYLAWKAGVTSGVAAYLAYGLIGGLAGIVAGRPPWRQETLWTTWLKGLFGFGIGLLLNWAAHKFLGGVHVSFAAALGAPPDRAAVDVPFLLGPLVGALPGIFFEVDDSVGAKPQAQAPKVEPAAAPRK